MKRARGFTLIEVLVALLVMALALSALLRVSGLAVENARLLRERMQAAWLAQDQLARLQAQGTSPPLGQEDGELTQDGQRWRWQRRVTALGRERVRQVEIRILAPGTESYLLASLTTFMGLSQEDE